MTSGLFLCATPTDIADEELDDEAIVHSGMLSKKTSKKLGGWEALFFTLNAAHQLQYFACKDDSVPLGQLLVTDICDIKDRHSSKKKRHRFDILGFAVGTKGGGTETLSVHAATDHDKQTWIKHFQRHDEAQRSWQVGVVQDRSNPNTLFHLLPPASTGVNTELARLTLFHKITV